MVDAKKTKKTHRLTIAAIGKRCASAHTLRVDSLDVWAIYDAAGCDLMTPTSVWELSRRLLGTVPVFAPLRTEAELSRTPGGWQVRVRRGTPPKRARWLAAHELAEWYLQATGYDGHDIEERCDRLGAAIVAPAPIVGLALRQARGLAHLAELLVTSESLALLRMAEITSTPTILLRDNRPPIMRGGAWPDGMQGRQILIGDSVRHLGLVAA